MEKYLLLQEKSHINDLITLINKDIYQPINQEQQEKMINFIKKNKDSSIDDLLHIYLTSLKEEMKSIIDTNLTLGIQFGIKTKNIQLEVYGGNYITNNKLKRVNEKTLFSLDSISKVITSIITTHQIRKKTFNFNTPINKINKEYQMDATIKSILNFTAYIQTRKRIDNLTKEETISLLKECKELIELKNNYNNYYKYNDIGYMILRQIIPNFIEELNEIIENTSFTYKNLENKENITGGKIGEEYITQDTKGRDIIFPGHTGLYGNINDILTLFNNIINTENILTNEEKEQLWKQPYTYPYSKDKTTLKEHCITKIAGIYKVPNNIKDNYDKLKLFDIPENTTNNSICSAGTCGSWVMNDNIMHNNYTIALLANPYSFIENKIYKDDINIIPNTNLTVNKTGKIINYPKLLNPYKKTLVNYAILLELITNYFHLQEKDLNKIKRLKKTI